MRIRSIRPEFWRSEDIDKLEWHDRLVFIGLWSYVDDNGVGRDRLSDITADLFAHDLSRDPRETLARVRAALERLREGGLIVRYTVEGKGYLFVTGWKKHQRIDRPTPGRYPPPTCGNAEVTPSLATDSRGLDESSTSGEGEKGRRGEGETTSSDLAGARPDQERPDVERLCEHLADRIEANGSKRPTITKGWRDAARRLMDLDKRTEQQVHLAIDWCQTDEFWRANILSMPKLRDKYDQLRLKAATNGKAHHTPASVDLGAAMQRAAARDAAAAAERAIE